MLAYYLGDLTERLSKNEIGSWEVSITHPKKVNNAIHIDTGGGSNAPLRNVDTGSRPIGTKPTPITPLWFRGPRSAANIWRVSRSAYDAQPYRYISLHRSIPRLCSFPL